MYVYVVLRTIFRVPQCEAGFLSLNYHSVWALSFVSERPRKAKQNTAWKGICLGRGKQHGVLCMPQAPASPIQIQGFEDRAPLWPCLSSPTMEVKGSVCITWAFVVRQMHSLYHVELLTKNLSLCLMDSLLAFKIIIWIAIIKTKRNSEDSACHSWELPFWVCLSLWFSIVSAPWGYF